MGSRRDLRDGHQTNSPKAWVETCNGFDVLHCLLLCNRLAFGYEWKTAAVFRMMVGIPWQVLGFLYLQHTTTGKLVIFPWQGIS